MAYATLTAGEGFLQNRTSLDADAKAYAESAATDFIDSTFVSWTRTSWTGADIPREIERIALKWATYEYQTLILQGKAPEWVLNLRQAAEDDAARVIGAGGPLLADGTRQAQTAGTDPEVSRYIEIQTG